MLTQCDAHVRNHILLVHNYYQSHAPSGEDKVFEEDERLLRARGHDITLYTHHSDVIKRFSTCYEIINLRVHLKLMVIEEGDHGEGG